jgi:uncharacterized protein YdeI (YjbR/CyaY-like superfamily)
VLWPSHDPLFPRAWSDRIGEFFAALAGDDAARAAFDALSFTHRKEWVRWVEEAKKADTRATRLAKTVESLRAGQRTG